MINIKQIKTISIPSGAIKSVIYWFLDGQNIFISIPSGAIKSLTPDCQLFIEDKFQFLLVRLRERLSRLSYSPCKAIQHFNSFWCD